MIAFIFFSIIKSQTIKQIKISLPMPVSGQDLVQLIENTRRYPQGSPKRQRALHNLLLVVQKFPKLKKSNNPNYLDALSLTWEWFIKNIDKFEYDPNSLELVEKRLTHWVNGYLGWRIRDLYTSDDKYKYDSLDEPIGDDEDNRTLSDTISNAPNNRNNNTIQNIIDNEQQENTQRIGLKVESYIKNDPEHRLRQCYPTQIPNLDPKECNAQILAKKMFVDEPPKKLKPIAEDMGIKYQSLVSFWKRKGLPLLREIVIELGYQPPEVS